MVNLHVHWLKKESSEIQYKSTDRQKLVALQWAALTFYICFLMMLLSADRLTLMRCHRLTLSYFVRLYFPADTKQISSISIKFKL